MSARLHVVLGQGGVGKTTLAAGYALALARDRRVGLLGADPSERLRDALGADLDGRERELPGVPRLRAALLRPGESLRRWIAAGLHDDPARLEANPFFAAVADRLAAATDALAAIRMVEWAEADPELDELVVDTAPGLNGIELLARPERLASLVHGRTLAWLARALSAGPVDRAGLRLLRVLSPFAGVGLVAQMAEFAIFVERLGAVLLGRLQRASEWLRRADTELLLVCAVRPDAAAGARALAAELRALSLAPTAVVLNRALPEALGDARFDERSAEATRFARLVRTTLRLQRAIASELRPELRAVPVPFVDGLDAPGTARLRALESLGAALLAR